MRPVLSREQMRAFDGDAINAAQVPGLVLMENAGRGAAEVIAAMLAERRPAGLHGARVLVVCGGGNNGGDGFVVARRLLTLGASPRVLLCARQEKLKGDALTNAKAWLGLGMPVTRIVDVGELCHFDPAAAATDLVVDALFGTGLDREVTGLHRSVIERLNEVNAPVVALDIPSGIDADTGAVLGAATRCEATVTFGHLKLGLLGSAASEYTGKLHVVDIGVPSVRAERVGAAAHLVDVSDIRALLTPRSPAAHKGSAGRVVVFAGSPGKTGAALLVSRGALRAGAGLVTIATSAQAADALDARVLEEMTMRVTPDEDNTITRALERVDAVAIGPGLGLDDCARRLVDCVVLRHAGPVVVDADALTLFRGSAEELMAAAGPRLLTPHPGEMARLLEISTSAVEENRYAAVERCCELTGAVVLLKGPNTIVGAPERVPFVLRGVAPALATGGAGDVLTGICVALACQLPLLDAALVGAYVHGRAAQRWMETTRADRGLLAHEVADGVPTELGELLKDSVP